MSILFVFSLLAVLAHSLASSANSSKPLLLVFSFDGLGPDFLNEVLTPNLWNLAKEGVWSPKGVKPQVVTVTAANYFSIATGLYQENHGIIGNSFYDPEFKEKFDYWTLDDPVIAPRSREAKWYNGEPIWETNEKAGGKSGGMRWPECDIKGTKISHCSPWQFLGNLSTWTKDLDQLVSWFTDQSRPINLGLMYVQDPDTAEHRNDIFSQTVRDKLKELDTLVGKLVDKLKEKSLFDKMNLLFVADHGHTNVYGSNNVINLDEILDPNDYIFSSKSMFPNTEKGVTVDQLYKKLKAAQMKQPRFELWLKKDFPDRYRHKNHRRIGPIILIEKLGYLFNSSQFNASHELAPTLPIYGKHGFLNDYHEMWPAFFAVGPAFKKNLVIDWEIENIDLHNLMASVLKIKPAKNDGNFTRVSALLKNPQQ